MIEAQNPTKRYGETTAVSNLTFSVKPGIVTGFLGLNGSGKSTTMRLILGLDAPSEGQVNELIELVGLESVAKKHAGQFSLGMGQRLGIASALLGDPEVMILPGHSARGANPRGDAFLAA
jgi:ABC-2 type transport system ATP-binding protein